MAHLLYYSECKTLEGSSNESQARDFLIENKGLSEELADRLIENSLDANLPIGLKTFEAKNNYRNDIMKLEGNYVF